MFMTCLLLSLICSPRKGKEYKQKEKFSVFVSNDGCLIKQECKQKNFLMSVFEIVLKTYKKKVFSRKSLRIA